MPEILYAVEDNAEGRLNAGISAAATTIVLQSGEGAEFPQPYTGTASSAGSATTLNDTGDLGGLAAGDFIRNVTDGSWAFVTAAGTNSVTTTRLRGGTDNTWDSGDEWQANEFVVTLEKRDASTPPQVTQREKVLVKNRSSDTLTVRTRGYDGSTAAAFDTNDYVNLHVVAAHFEHLVDCLYDMAVRENTNQTDIATNAADIDSIESNASFYVAAAGSSNAFTGTLAKMPAAYTAGERLVFKANHDVTGSATFNRNSLGAKTIKKVTTAGKANLESGDVQDTGVYELVYDGTDYVLLTPVANIQVAKQVLAASSTADSTAVGASSTAEANLDTNYTITANSAVAGDVFHLKASGVRNGSGTPVLTLRVKIGSSTLLTHTLAAANGDEWHVDAWITVRSVGASGTVIAHGTAVEDGAPVVHYAATNTATTTIDFTAAQVLQISAQFNASNASNNCSTKQFIVEKMSL